MKNKNMKSIAVLLAFLMLLTLCFTGCTQRKTDKSPVLTTGNIIQGDITEAYEEEGSTETTAPTPPESDDDFVKISDFAPTIKIDLRYSTANNFTGRVIYNFTDAYIRYGTMKKLIAVQEELAENGVGLYIWDAYRPVYAQAELYNATPAEKQGIYVASPKGGNHSKGHTVDVTLYDLETGELLEMPSEFDDFSEAAHPALLDDDTKEVRENLSLLTEAMTKDGRFSTISSEWWHFVDTDSYEMSDFNPVATDNNEVLASKLSESLTDARVLAFDTLPAE